MNKAYLYGSVAIASLMMASNASAQAAGDGVSSMEIIVTAQKRAENIQDVAGNVTALGAERLSDSGVDNIVALQGLVPGVHVETRGGAAFIYLRGVGSSQIIGDPTVAFHLDGVYLGRGSAPNGAFYDMARVEVLKGPQGTLYGRNATVGAINVLTNKPGKEFEISGTAGYASFDRLSGDAVINLPVSDTFSLRAAGRIVNDDGYMSNGANDAHDVGVRVKALLEPSDDFSFLLTGDYFLYDGHGPSTVGLFSTVAGCSGGRFCRASDPWYTPETAGSVRNENWGVNAEVTGDMGGVTLTVQPAYRRTQSSQFLFTNNQAAGSNFEIAADQISMEARLASDGAGPLKWLVGGYYLHEDTSFTQIIRSVFAGPGLLLDAFTMVPSSEATAVALFGDATYSPTDKLRLTAGLRYNDERKTQKGSADIVFTARPAGSFIPLNVHLNAYPLTGAYAKRKTTWKAGIEYDVTPDSLLYLTGGTGFKGGGINREAAPNTYADESITAITFGTKNSFMDHRLVINAEVFYWDYDNRQNEQFSPLNTNGLLSGGNTPRDFKVFNLGRQHIYGLDVDAAFSITDHDHLFASVSYLHGRYTDDPANNFAATTIALSPFFSLVVEPGADLRGKTLAHSPEFSGTVGYEHEFDLGDSGNLTARVETQFQTSSFTQYRLAAASLQPGYTRSSFTLEYKSESDRFRLKGFVRNIENTATVRNTSATALTTAAPLYFGFMEPPRTYGMELSFKY